LTSIPAGGPEEEDKLMRCTVYARFKNINIIYEIGKRASPSTTSLKPPR